MWREAVLKVLIGDVVQLVARGGPLLIGAMIGASLGSIRRWYGARWQLGVIAGLWIGVDLALLRELHGVGVFPMRLLDTYVAAGCFGALAALVVSLCASFWLARTESPWVRTFRDHPWRWTRSRWVRVFAVSFLLLAGPIWLLAQSRKIRAYEEILTVERRIRPVSELWWPYEAHVYPFAGGAPENGLKLTVRTPKGLSPAALELLDDGPWLFVELEIHVTNDVRDRDLIAAAEALTTIRTVRLVQCGALTDECLPALAQCPELTELTIFDCPGITGTGLNEFKKTKRGVKLTQMDGPKVRFFSSP